MALPPPPPPPPEVVADAPRAGVRASLVAFVQTTCDAEAVEVRWLGLAVTPPDGAALHWSGDPCHPSPALRLSAVVDEAVAGTWAVRPSLVVTVPAPVAPRHVQAGERFEPARGTARIETVRGLRPDGPLIALRPLSAGQALTPRVVRPAPDVTSGQSVQVVVERGPVRIAARGTVLRDGFVGRDVQVRNEATGAVHRGTLADPDTVVLP